LRRRRRRLCGACENELRGDQRIWCSRACSRWVSSAGGPAAAAAIFRNWADGWFADYELDRKPAYRRTAKDLLARVRRLRRVRFKVGELELRKRRQLL